MKFPERLPVDLQLTVRGDLQSAPNDAVTFRNIFETPVVEYLSVPSLFFFWMFSTF